MIKARLVRIEKSILPKELPWICCNVYDDGVCVYEGQKFTSVEEFKAQVKPTTNVIYLRYFIPSGADNNSPKPHSDLDTQG